MSTRLLTDSPLLPSGRLDDLLDEVCIALQITDAQYETAKSRYEAIGDWLSAVGSPIAALRPRIYAQGSAAIQTTVRPRGAEEYDLDLVCEVERSPLDPMGLYEAVWRRLADHATYRPMLERKNRCIRVNYARLFHLDILPAKPDPRRGGTCVLVPDREMRGWKESNPRGYAAWFAGRSAALIEARKTEPLPANDPAHAKAPLKRGVQLLKRHRDMAFGDDGGAPRSVVLTTLAAKHYRGQSSVLDGLRSAVSGMRVEAAGAAGVLVVPNPSNEAENFAEAWTPTTFAHFKAWIASLDEALARLASAQGMPNIARLLSELFGEKVASLAVEGYTARIEKARAEGALRYTPAVGIITGSTRGSTMPKNTFFGD